MTGFFALRVQHHQLKKKNMGSHDEKYHAKESWWGISGCQTLLENWTWPKTKSSLKTCQQHPPLAALILSRVDVKSKTCWGVPKMERWMANSIPAIKKQHPGTVELPPHHLQQVQLSPQKDRQVDGYSEMKSSQICINICYIWNPIWNRN